MAEPWEGGVTTLLRPSARGGGAQRAEGAVEVDQRGGVAGLNGLYVEEEHRVAAGVGEAADGSGQAYERAGVDRRLTLQSPAVGQESLRAACGGREPLGLIGVLIRQDRQAATPGADRGRRRWPRRRPVAPSRRETARRRRTCAPGGSARSPQLRTERGWAAATGRVSWRRGSDWPRAPPPGHEPGAAGRGRRRWRRPADRSRGSGKW